MELLDDEETQRQKALLCYVCFWVGAVVYLIIEKESEFVRFHAIQSVVTFLPATALWAVLLNLPLPIYSIHGLFARAIASTVFAIVTWGPWVLWVLMVYKIGGGEHYSIPAAGYAAEKYA